MKRRSFLKVVAGGALSLAFARPSRAQSIDAPRGELRAFILSDINASYGSVDYAPGIKQAIGHALSLWQPDIVLSPGDLIAGQSHNLPLSRFPEMWEAFDRHVLDRFLAAGIPFAPAMGNHDASSIRRGDGAFAFAREREAAQAFWSGVDPGLWFIDRGNFPFYYSFAFSSPEGEVFVLVWDASSATISASELAWAEAALLSPRAQSAALRLVLGHLPLFGVAEGRNLPGEVVQDGDEIRRMLERVGAHSYISGHHHAYYPGERGALGLLHAGGVGPRRLLGSSQAPRTTVTIMDISFKPVTLRYSTFDIATWQEIVLHTLPERINGLNGSVTRRG